MGGPVGDGGFILDTPQEISDYRLRVLYHSLKLEVLGMRRSRGPSCASVIKAEFGFTGTNKRVLQQYKTLLIERGLLPNEHTDV